MGFVERAGIRFLVKPPGIKNQKDYRATLARTATLGWLEFTEVTDFLSSSVVKSPSKTGYFILNFWDLPPDQLHDLEGMFLEIAHDWGRWFRMSIFGALRPLELKVDDFPRCSNFYQRFQRFP